MKEKVTMVRIRTHYLLIMRRFHYRCAVLQLLPRSHKLLTDVKFIQPGPGDGETD